MHLKLRKIGNSRGIIIPASVLDTLGIGNGLEMSVSNDSIILKASNNIREGGLKATSQRTTLNP